MSGKLLKVNADGDVTFWCPGCDGGHRIRVGQGRPPRWDWNGDTEKPTFTPSVLVRYEGADADKPEGLPSVCHSFITDGQIRYLEDSTHVLAGKTVDLPAVWE